MTSSDQFVYINDSPKRIEFGQRILGRHFFRSAHIVDGSACFADKDKQPIALICRPDHRKCDDSSGSDPCCSMPASPTRGRREFVLSIASPTTKVANDER